MQRTYRIQHVVTTIRRASTRGRTTPPAKSPPGKPPAKASPRSKPSKIEQPATPPAEPPPSPSPSTPPKQNITPSQLTPSRAIPWVLASLLGGAIGFYTIQLYIAATQPCHNPSISLLESQKDVSARYDDTADNFDAEVGFSEMLMGVNSLRKRLALQCRGHVLEASCGTGRNLGYFDLRPGSDVESLTFVDLSPKMVEVCRRKWDVLVGEERDGVEKGRLSGRAVEGKMKRTLVVRFLTGSALDVMPPPPAIATRTDDVSTPQPVARKEKYTTILQTMGLCSTPSPHLLLSSLASHLDTSDPAARILLLEHGRSYLPWLNRILDNSAEKHAEIHGCWYNRDIGGLVEDEAAKAGLDVKRVRRHHLGTTWVFELGPGEEMLKAARKEGDGTKDDSVSGGWGSWLPWK